MLLILMLWYDLRIKGRLVGIMLQITFIILFQISLKLCLHYAQLYFYAVSFITIPYLQFKLSIKVSYFSYLMLVETLKSTHFISLMLSLSVMNTE